MARIGSTGIPEPYKFFGTFAGLPCWGGGLTLLSAAPGIGKTSWMLKMLYDAALSFPSALMCYEHTEDELKFRIAQQAKARIAGPHGAADVDVVEREMAEIGNGVLEALRDDMHTVPLLEDILLQTYGFPVKGPALVLIDYLNRVPVVGLTRMLEVKERSGNAAIELREMAKRHGWAVLASAALNADAFSKNDEKYDLSDLFGDERVPYTADRVYLISRDGMPASCGCVDLKVHTLKDRTGMTCEWDVQFWGGRFYPAIGDERQRHG
jgi:hypothetical protein